MPEKPTQSAPPLPKPGDPPFAGRFTILDRIGEGTTSVVYKARDQKTGQVYALKVWRVSTVRDPGAEQRFQLEVELGRRIDHPNVVHLLDAGRDDDRLYLVMEYVGGQSLAESLLLTPKIPECEFLPLARQVVAALTCIHAQGIVHRDLKPANLMFARDGTLKLMDFGIARTVDARATLGIARGTAEYMAPEQLLGQSVTASSDLFSAGVVFYEMLSGRHPFRGMGPAARVTQAPPRLREILPEISAEVAAAVERCLEPMPESRPATAGALLEMLPADATPEVKVEVPPVPLPPAPTRTLGDMLDARPRPYQETLPVMLNVVRRIRQIRAGGEIHEPITPQNVRLRRDGMPEIIAHPPVQARDTWAISTPRYSAPELLRGSFQPGACQQERATVYTLGLIFYEIIVGRERLSGQLPEVFQKNNDLAWLEWQTNPAARLAALPVPEYPAEVSRFFDRVLEKDPARRTATLEEMERGLDRLVHSTLKTEMLQIQAVVDGGAVEESALVTWARDRFRSNAVIAGATFAAIALLLIVVKILSSF